MYALGTKLIERGYEVGLACGGKVGEHNHGPEWFSEAGIRTFYVPFPGRKFNPAQTVQALKHFMRVVKEYHPDLIHVHWRATSPYAYLASRFYKIPVVATLHLDGIPARGHYRFLSFWGDKVIAISSETREYLRNSFNVSEARLRVVFNGVDEKLFRPPATEERTWARRQFGVPEHEKVVSIVARLVPAKGHDVLLKAAGNLKRKGISFRLICAGTGGLKDEIVKWIQDLDLEENVILPGYVDSRTVLWASDLFVLPSRQEGFALAVVEAMLCGVVPIRTPSAGAYDQINDGVDGFIVPFEDHEAIAARIEQLLTDDDLRKTMADAAYEKACRLFTLQHMVENTMAVYEEVLKKS